MCKAVFRELGVKCGAKCVNEKSDKNINRSKIKIVKDNTIGFPKL